MNATTHKVFDLKQFSNYEQLITKFANRNIGISSQGMIGMRCKFIMQFLKYLNKPIDKITQEDIIQWVDNLISCKYEQKGIRNRFTSVFMFFGWCIDCQILAENPCSRIPRSVYKRDK